MMPILNPYHIPLGQCHITYGQSVFQNHAEDGYFGAIPEYETAYFRFGEKIYFLKNMNVSMNLVVPFETYDNLKYAIPYLQEDEHGLFDNPVAIDRTGQPLIVHPKERGEDKSFDITILRAIPDPEQEFKRTYGKGVDKFPIRFIGFPAKNFTGSAYKSYFYIGDWDTAGVLDD